MEPTHTQDAAELTISAAAKIAHMSVDTLRRYANSGRLTVFRTPGNQRRFRESDVRALVQAERSA